jgi:phage terminase large subunit-like protein
VAVRNTDPAELARRTEAVRVCAVARKYAEDVVAGNIPAGWRLTMACRRQLDDLDRWGQWGGVGRLKARGEFYFDERAAAAPVAFIERCCSHVKDGFGSRVGARIRLEPWQIFLVATLFGWLSTETGRRRYRIFYIELARKNAKSTLLACLALYALIADGVGGAEVYSAATNYTQASLVWEVGQQMVPHSPALNRRIGPHRSRALHLPDGSRFRPVHAKALGNEGLNPSFTVMDELHAHPSPNLWNVFRQGMGARLEPMLGAITTAGSNQAGVCFAERLYGEGILNGTYTDERYAVFIWAADDSDDPGALETWLKANPNFGVSVDPVDFAQKYKHANRSPSDMADFKTKALCIWVGAGNPFFDLARFDAGADPALKPDDFKGLPCWMGVDLAARYDIAGFDLLFRKDDGSVVDFHRFYSPRALIDEGGQMANFARHFLDWEEKGHIQFTEGDVIDFDVIGKDLREWADAFAPNVIGFDTHQHAQIAVQLTSEGRPVIEIPPYAKHYSPAVKEMKSLMFEGKYRHPGNGTMRWMVGNTYAEENWKEEVYPRKEKKGSPAKIDGVTMSAISMSQSMSHEETAPQLYVF